MLLPIIWIGVFGGMPWNSPKDPFCPHMYLWNLKKTIYLFGKTDSIQGEKPEKLFCTNFAFLDIWKNSNSIIVYHGFWVVYTYSQNFWVTPQNKSSMLATRQRCFGDFEWIYYLVCTFGPVCVTVFHTTIPVSAPLIMAFADRCQVETGRTVLSWQMAVAVVASVQQKALLPLSHLHFAALESDIVVLTV